MSAINDGGPAYPVDELSHTTPGLASQNFGMSMRDYFAAKAMQGIYAMVASRQHSVSAREPEKQIATEAYAMADAMLRAREQS